VYLVVGTSAFFEVWRMFYLETPWPGFTQGQGSLPWGGWGTVAELRRKPVFFKQRGVALGTDENQPEKPLIFNSFPMPKSRKAPSRKEFYACLNSSNNQ
jgi:hypothetical protein